METRESHETSQPRLGGMASGAARFGPLLRSYRLAVGLTLQELAKVTGVSRRTISALESAQSQIPRPRTIERLADGLRLDPEARAALTAAGRGALILRPRFQRLAATAPNIVLPAVAPDTPKKKAHNLPLASTSLLGRESDVAELTTLVQGQGSRLITVTGPGGVGKTCLALEVAWALYHAKDAFPDGVWFVRLAPLTDPALVIPTIAQALAHTHLCASTLPTRH